MPEENRTPCSHRRASKRLGQGVRPEGHPRPEYEREHEEEYEGQEGRSSRNPAAAACPATVQWALAFQSNVIPATAALARPIERVSKVRSCGASSRTRTASRATKAASRNTAGVRRSARAEIQKSPPRERRRIRNTYPATAAAAVNSTAR